MSSPSNFYIWLTYIVRILTLLASIFGSDSNEETDQKINGKNNL